MKKFSSKYFPLSKIKSYNEPQSSPFIESPNPNQPGLFLSHIQLFRYAKFLDILLISLGILSSFLSSFLFTKIFLFFGKIVQSLVELLRSQIKCGKTLNLNSNSTDPNLILSQQTDNIVDSDSVVLYLKTGLACMALNYLGYVCINSAAERQMKRIKFKLLESILNEDNICENLKEQYHSLNKNLNVLKSTIGPKFAELVALLSKAVACVIISTWMAGKLSVVLLLLAAVVLIITLYLNKKLKYLKLKEKEAYSRAHSLAKKLLISIRTVVALGMEKNAAKMYKNSLKSTEVWKINRGFWFGALSGLRTFFHNFTYSVLILVGVSMNRQQGNFYTPGLIMQTFFSIMFVIDSLERLVRYFKDLCIGRRAASNLFVRLERFDKKKKIVKKKGEKIFNLRGEISFANVTFTYSGVPSLKGLTDNSLSKPKKKIFENLNFVIPAGKTVTICGNSGCGKSTLFSLIQQFHSPDSGEIKIDGHNLLDLDKQWLRQQISLIDQDPALFTTTIRENIRLGKIDATEYEIQTAGKNANADHFITNLPNKYDTHLGKRSIKLSSLQKQRISIARALIRNPKILLFDCESALENGMDEKFIQKSLSIHSRNHFYNDISRTIVLITQNLTTIKGSDSIICLPDKPGDPIEQGTHEELMLIKGRYYVMVKAKSSDHNESNNFSSSSDESTASTSDEFSDTSSVHTKSRIKEPKSSTFYYNKKIFNYQSPQTAYIILGSVTQFMAGAANPLIVIYFTTIYEIFILRSQETQSSEIKNFMIYITLMAAIHLMTVLLSNYSFQLCEAKLVKNIRVKMFQSVLNQDMEFHDQEKNRPAILLKKLSEVVPWCVGLSTATLNLYCQALGTFFFVFIFTLIYCPNLTPTFLIYTLIVIANTVIMEKLDTKKIQKRIYSTGDENLLLTEVLDNIKCVASYSLETNFMKIFKLTINKKILTSLASLHFKALLFSFDTSMEFLLQAVVFSHGYSLVLSKQLKITHLLEFYALLGLTKLMIVEVYAQLPEHKQAKYAARTAFKIINRKPKIDSQSEDGSKPERLRGDIEFRNVDFSYPTRPDIKVLNGFSVLIKSGETNGLVGKSGCGKTTIFSLILRFYDVTNGMILIDGRDIKTLNVQWLRSKIAVVSQEPALFKMSIRENILNGDVKRNNIKFSELVDIVQKCYLKNVIENFPKSYDTLIGLETDKLTISEKQRISIARALIREPKIVLTDCAFSLVEQESERLVQEALEKLYQGRTCIVIARKLTKILNSDKIHVIKDGTVIETNSRYSMSKTKKLFCKEKV